MLAKQDYFGELGLVGVYDEKASSEFTLYGLPMWQIGGRRGRRGICVRAGGSRCRAGCGGDGGGRGDPVGAERRRSSSSSRRPG